MSSIIKFKAISGAFDEGPLSYLLEIDDFKFLLDCGWNESCSSDVLDRYKHHIKTVDAILISYPDVAHLGALPYLINKLSLNCQVFSTVPVYKMGQMYLYDLFLSKQQSEEFDLFNMDDIDNAFDKIQQVKYSQTVNLKGKGQGLQITALPGGHIIGGTIWRILKDGEEEIIYAVDYNHHKERHLNGCVMNIINKPTLLITDAYNFLYNQPKKRIRDEKFLERIITTLRNDGNVLVCTDTAGRVLELAHFLETLWRNESSGLFSYSIALLNMVAISTIEFAKSQVEWMNDKIVQTFETGRANPFDFKHIKLCTTLSDLNRIVQPSRNKLVLTSLSDMECGFAKNLFLDWCESSKNTVLFTQRPAPNTLASRLYEMGEASNERPNKKISVEVKSKVKLEGEELEEYYREQLEKEKEKIDKLKKSAELESIDDDSSSGEEGENILGMETNIPSDKHDLMKIPETKSRFFKHRKQYPMYPYKEKQIKWDDYGEFVKLEDFVPLSELNRENETKQESQDVEMAPEQLELLDENNSSNIVPTKFISERVEVTVRCRIASIDYEGRSDGESIKKIVSSIKPRNLILVHGSERSTTEMREFCAKQQIVSSSADRIFSPRVGELVDATLETQIYNVRLTDELVSSLNFQKLRDYELAWVDAIVKAKDLQNPENEFGTTTSVSSSSIDYGFSLHPLPREIASQAEQHKTVFVNEPKLSDLKQILLHNDIQAEFHGGVLVCNRNVALKKNQAGRIILEGIVSEDYYKVRKILYEQYAML